MIPECLTHEQLIGVATVFDYVLKMWSGMVEMTPFSGGQSIYYMLKGDVWCLQ